MIVSFTSLYYTFSLFEIKISFYRRKIYSISHYYLQTHSTMKHMKGNKFEELRKFIDVNFGVLTLFIIKFI